MNGCHYSFFIAYSLFFSRIRIIFMRFQFSNLLQMPIHMPPLINQYLVHIAWIGGVGQFKMRTQIQFSGLNKFNSLITSSQKKSEVVFSFNKTSWHCKIRCHMSFIFHNERCVVTVRAAGGIQFRLRFVPAAHTNFTRPYDFPQCQMLYHLSNRPPIG